MRRTLAAVAAAAALAGGCGGGGDEPAADRRAPSGDSAPSGSLTDGTGYRVAVPKGWRDVSDELKGAAVNFDLVVAGESHEGFATNVNVIRETPGGSAELDALLEQLLDQVEPLADDAGVGEVQDRELGGEPAKTYSYRLERKEEPAVRQRQVLAVKGDAVFTVTFSAAADVFEEQEQQFTEMLASWRWE